LKFFTILLTLFCFLSPIRKSIANDTPLSSFCDLGEIKSLLLPNRSPDKASQKPKASDPLLVEFLSIAEPFYKPEQCERILELNFLGFLKADPHQKSNFVSPSLIEKALVFRQENQGAFSTVSKKFQIDQNVLLSFILIETRLGKNTGKFSLPTVLLVLAATERDSVWEFLVNSGLKIDPKQDKNALLKTFKEKTAKRRILARQEIEAVLRLRSKWPEVMNLSSSFAMAFGLPQFIPSSYEKYALPYSKTRAMADLFRPSDAIMSIGNYMQSFGWGPTLNEKRNAVYQYNRSYSYVDLILETADTLKKRRKEHKPH
jgi:membrane-bound lytic murein transglycosylase B